jgi:GT2 family glycosyltransferase
LQHSAGEVRRGVRELSGAPCGLPHEIIGIHDARSLCEGYNRGIRRATGDVVILSHDDVVIVNPDFAARLLAHLTSHDLVGVAGTTRLIGGNWVDAGWPHLHGQIGSQIHQPGKLVVTAYQVSGATVLGAQALDGAFLALRREAFERVQFDERTFDGWHLYDLDFSFSAHLAGLRTAICNDLCLIHNSIGAYRTNGSATRGASSRSTARGLRKARRRRPPSRSGSRWARRRNGSS